MDENTIPETPADSSPEESTRGLAPISLGTKNDVDVLATSLKALAGTAGSDIQSAVEHFLGGEGELLEATRAASGKASKTAKEELAAFLTNKLKISPTLAKLMAPILLKMIPVLGKTLEKDAKEKPEAKPKPKPKPTAKPKAKPKKKPKATDDEKPASTTKKKPKKKPAAEEETTPKKPKKKPAAKPKPKTTAKKPAKKTAKKTTTKKKKTSRSETVE